jgi:hypothetical protein
MVLLTKAQAQWHRASCSRVAPRHRQSFTLVRVDFTAVPPTRLPETRFWSDRSEPFPPLKLNYLSAQFFWGFWNSLSASGKRFAELIGESLRPRPNQQERRLIMGAESRRGPQSLFAIL